MSTITLPSSTPAMGYVDINLSDSATVAMRTGWHPNTTIRATGSYYSGIAAACSPINSYNVPFVPYQMMLGGGTICTTVAAYNQVYGRLIADDSSFLGAGQLVMGAVTSITGSSSMVPTVTDAKSMRWLGITGNARTSYFGIDRYNSSDGSYNAAGHKLNHVQQKRNECSLATTRSYVSFGKNAQIAQFGFFPYGIASATIGTTVTAIQNYNQVTSLTLASVGTYDNYQAMTSITALGSTSTSARQVWIPPKSIAVYIASTSVNRWQGYCFGLNAVPTTASPYNLKCPVICASNSTYARTPNATTVKEVFVSNAVVFGTAIAMRMIITNGAGGAVFNHETTGSIIKIGEWNYV